MSAEPEVMPRLPKCPHCKQVLEGMAMFQWITNGWLIIAMYRARSRSTSTVCPCLRMGKQA